MSRTALADPEGQGRDNSQSAARSRCRRRWDRSRRSANATHVKTLVARSLAAGAKLVTGGTAPEGAGFYYRPDILDCDGSASPSLENEFFGPVLSVLSFETEAESSPLANDSRSALQPVSSPRISPERTAS